MEMEKFFMKLGAKIADLIYYEMEKEGINGISFDTKVTVVEREDGFRKEREYIVFDNSAKAYCDFCGRETEYYDEELEMNLCPACFGEVKYAKQNKRQ